MKKQLFLLVLISLLTYGAAAKSKLPPQLLRNWLSPTTNEWVFRFADSYILTKGIYWNYKVVSIKNHQYQLVLNQKGIKKTLYVNLVDEHTARIAYTPNPRATYTTKINENPNYGKHLNTGFNTPLIKVGMVHVNGLLIGYSPRLDNYHYMDVIYGTLLMSTQVTKAVALDSLGRFSFDFEMDSPHEVFIHFGDNGEQFYVIPGHSVTLGVEINRINKAETTDDTYTRPKMLFMGEDALLNTGFNDFNYRLKQIINSRNDDENQKRLDPVAYKAYRLEVMRQMQDTLADYSKRHNPEITFRQYFEQNIKYQATNDLLRYGWTNGRKKLMPDYFDFFTAADFENELGPLTAEYIYTLYELSVIPYDSVDPMTSPSIEDVITLAKESDYKFTPEQEEFAKKNIIFKVKGPDTLAYISNADSASNSNHNAIFEGLWEGGHKAVDLQKEKRRKQLFERIGLTDNTLGIDIIHATAAYGKINNKKGISVADFEKYNKTIKNQELINELTTQNKDYQVKNKEGLSARMHVIDPIAQSYRCWVFYN